MRHRASGSVWRRWRGRPFVGVVPRGFHDTESLTESKREWRAASWLTESCSARESGRSVSEPRALRIVAGVTGERRVDHVAVAIADGADGYIAKPVSAKILMSHLVKLIAADGPVQYLE